MISMAVFQKIGEFKNSAQMVYFSGVGFPNFETHSSVAECRGVNPSKNHCFPTNMFQQFSLVGLF